jgi:hypothetical protein
MDIETIIAKYPKLNWLKSPAFQSLNREKQEFLLGCVEDALFWVEQEKKPEADDGFKFLAITYGLQKAETEANTKGLEGKEREKFLEPLKKLYTQFNPHSC